MAISLAILTVPKLTQPYMTLYFYCALCYFDCASGYLTLHDFIY